MSKKIKAVISTERMSPEFDPNEYEGLIFDILIHAWLSRFIGWLSPASLNLALFDWLIHLAFSPAKRGHLLKQVGEKIWQLFYMSSCLASREEMLYSEKYKTDPRFLCPQWCHFPFNLYANIFLSVSEWWDEATSSVRGVSKHHQQVVNFQIRQLLDIYSPSNYPLTNPEVFAKTLHSWGFNLINGFRNLSEDIYRYFNHLPPVGIDKFKVGENLAITPGKVIYRNHLIELIQYEPKTRKVYATPVLIIPAWIMKYYILDLSPHNSLVKYLVAHGHTVFMISWRNPGRKDRELGMNDYLHLGVLDALDSVKKITSAKSVHTVGYCIGGTLLMTAAAAMAATPDNGIASITLFAAQVDFKEAGELLLFIDQSQITYLEDIMWERGYLDGPQMKGAFSMLHSNNLIWSRIVHNYLLGERHSPIDLIAWDHDTTRLPMRMHSEYLRSMFLNNDLSQGRFKVERKKVALPDITAPIFAVSTRTDHVSPWKSVYKVHLFCDTEITFVLTTGGHNAGIVSEPGHRNRSYQLLAHQEGDKHHSAEVWQEIAPHYEGSWWPAWQQWLASKSLCEKIKPPPMGNVEQGLSILCDAPGTYVHDK